MAGPPSKRNGERNDSGSARASTRAPRARGPARKDAIQGDASSSGRSGASAEDIALEAARYRKLQRAVDVTVALIHQTQGLSLGDMIEIVQHTRSIALELFPGSGETFDLLYRPRLIRAINERFGIEASSD